MRRVALGHLDDAALAEARQAHRRWMLRAAERCYQLQCERSPGSTAVIRRRGPQPGGRPGRPRRGRPPRGRPAGRAGCVAHGRRSAARAQRSAPRLEERADGDGEAAALCALSCRRCRAAARRHRPGGRAARRRRRATSRPGHPFRWVALTYRMTNALFVGDARRWTTTPARCSTIRSPRVGPGHRVGCAALINTYLGDGGGPELDRPPRRHARRGARRRRLRALRPRRALGLGPGGGPALVRGGARHQRSGRPGLQPPDRVGGTGRCAGPPRPRPEAAAACASTITESVRIGMWPQAWTTLRLAAELLVAVGEHEAAASVLAAAAHDELASEVLEADRDRHAVLWWTIDGHLSDDEVAAVRRAPSAPTAARWPPAPWRSSPATCDAPAQPSAQSGDGRRCDGAVRRLARLRRPHLGWTSG